MLAIHERVRAAEAVRAQFAGRVFVWNAADCLMLVRATARELGAEDPAVDAAPYGGPRAARAALKRLHFKTLEAAMDARCERIPLAFAMPADVVGFDSPHAGIIALGVVMGATSIVFGPGGDLQTVPTHTARAAWRITCRQ